MDHLCLPFSFDQINELLDYSPPNDTHFQHNRIIQQNDNVPSGIQVPVNPVTSGNPPNNGGNNIIHRDVNVIKKIIHRDVERRRRREMATLYRTLRSELPIECLKAGERLTNQGKRSAADHIHETVGYIRQMQRRIEKMNEKKEKLKRLQMSNPGSSLIYSTTSLKECSKPICDNQTRQTSVEVNCSTSGIEASINTDVCGGLNLSGVLKIVSEVGGLSVKSCVSAKVNSRMLHNLGIEVNKGQNARAVELQRKLIDLCNRSMTQLTK